LRHALTAFLFASACLSSAEAQTLGDAILNGKPVIDVRGRYEAVNDTSKSADAGIFTVRARLGYETGSWNGLSLQTDVDQIWAIGAPYNSTRNGKTGYPIIVDPKMTALNRLQLTYAPDFSTRFVLGRQRLPISNQRFVGNVAWRQHEQTFDAMSAVNTSLPGLTLTYAWLYRINRVTGPNMPAPSNTVAAATGQASTFKSDSHIINAVYNGVPGLRLEAYSYLLDLSAPGYAALPAQTAATARLSSATFGARGDYSKAFDGVTGKISGEYAHQTDYAGNPLSFGLSYWLAEGSLTWKGVTGLIGYESLGGNGVIGFATPLATLHLFNGWADLFLTTPANGLTDLYWKTSYALPADFIGSQSLNLTVIWHDFKTERLNRGIGSEWDMQAELIIDPHFSVLAKYARYNGAGIAVGGFADKSVFWLQTAYKY